MINSKKKFSQRDIMIAAGALHTQLAAGVMMRLAVARMARLQKSHSNIWMDVQQITENGGTLSDAIEEHWPESVVAAVRAGERTGNVAEVMGNIQSSLEAINNVWKEVLKLLYPLAVLLGGLGIFIFFMVGVMPAITRSNPKAAEQSPVLRLSRWMSETVSTHGIEIAIVVAVVLCSIVAFLMVPANRQKMLYMIDRVPIIGEAIRSLWFGAWSYQMALLDKAGGIQVQECLRLSLSALPKVYQDGLSIMADEVVSKGLNDAATTSDDYDPRSKWPFYVTLSFQMAHETGNLGDKLLKFAPAMIQEGATAVTRFTAVTNLIALTISATLMAVPMAGYFTAIAGALKKAFG